MFFFRKISENPSCQDLNGTGECAAPPARRTLGGRASCNLCGMGGMYVLLFTLRHCRSVQLDLLPLPQPRPLLLLRPALPGAFLLPRTCPPSGIGDTMALSSET